MNFLLFLLANVIARAAASTSIRSPEIHVDKPVKVSNRNRRHLLKDSTCVLFQKCVTFPPTDEHPEGYDKHSWVCKLSSEDSSRFNTTFVNIDERSYAVASISNAISGTSTLTMSEAFIAADEQRLFVPKYARVEIGTVDEDIRETSSPRRLAATTGTLRTLVIRVSDKKNRVPDLSVDDMKDDVFDDAASLKTQMEGCSYGKLKIEPFVGYTPSDVYIDNGIVDMKMDYDAYSDEGDIGIESENAAWRFLGNLDDPMFGLILFCLPSGREKFYAYAYVNGKSSFYDNETCKFVAIQIHEVGHNLGLEHSGELGESEYGDGTGVMGIAPYADDVRLCFNAQKNYQLGWYSDQVESINPVDGTGSWSFVLNGVPDYQKNQKALIVLRLEQTELEQDYYIGYNRAKGIHVDVTEDRNKVIIVRKESGLPDTNGYSTKLAALTPGEDYVIDNFNGYQSVQITYVGGNIGNARIEVNDIGPSPTPAPGSCKEFTIEFTTDWHEEDNSWEIIDMEGMVVAEQAAFIYGSLKHTQRVCLPIDDTPQTYKFIVKDTIGDGVCCYYGYGMYRVFDDDGVEYLNSNFRDENFFSKDYEIEVSGKDANPTCKKFTIKFTTNAHPLDNSWAITNTEGIVVAEELSFTNPWFQYSRTVCLPMDSTPKTYKFTVMDSYGDGICCEYGDGIYTVIDDNDEVYLSSNFKYEEFFSREHSIEIPGIPPISPPPTGIPSAPPTGIPSTPPRPPCKAMKKAFRLERGGTKRKCKWYASRGFCDETITTGKNDGKSVWELCTRGCNRC